MRNRVCVFAAFAVAVPVVAAAQGSAPPAPSATAEGSSAAAPAGGAASAPKAIQVPTGAFFGSLSGTVAWPTNAKLGKPRNTKKACESITVRALRREPSPDGSGQPVLTEIRSVQARGGPFPKACSFKLEGIRIRQDVVVEATFPASEWGGCTAEITSGPAPKAKWANPVSLPKSQDMATPLALRVACKR